jgi:hypothetical protein
MPDATLRMDTDYAGRMRLFEQMEVLSMPGRTRRNVVKRMVRQVQKDARANIRSQKTTRGLPMEARKDSRVRRKMLRGLSREMTVFMRGNSAADVTWRNGLTAKIADRHQRGVPEPWNRGKARKVYGVPDYKANATRAQAKSLKAEGYRLRVKKKRGKGCRLVRVSLRWITENLSRGQAGLILRLMRTNRKRGARSWEIRTPARPFLGPRLGDEDTFLTGLARQAISEIRNR